MRVMSRKFTLTEKVIMGIVIVALLGLVYYKFVDQPIRESIASAQADMDTYQMQLDEAQARLARLQSVQNDLDSVKEANGLSYLASYNNSKAEVAFLNDILSDTLQYSISFDNISRNGDLLRRKFTLQYKTIGYDEAKAITQKLAEGELRCLVGDVLCRIDAGGVVTINETATFYETMIGGVADAGLPADSAASK